LITFNGDSYFVSSEFNGAAYFLGSEFNGDANFAASEFNGMGEFVFSKFNGTTCFSGAKFNSIAFFEFSEFKNTTDFEGDIFEEEANFNDAKFDGKISFNSSTFKADALFENALFNSTLYLTRTKYDRLYIDWANINKLAYDKSAYQLLIENFKKLGFMYDADSCYYQFKVEQFLHQNWIYDPFISLLNFGAWIFYGYGKRPIYPVLWSVFSIGLFGIFWIAVSLASPKDAISKYNLGKSRLGRAFSIFLITIISIIWRIIRLDKSKREMDEYDQPGTWPDSIKDALGFSATVFLSGTKLFVDPPVIPLLPGRYQSLIKRAFSLERVLGAFFSILFFLAIGATVIR
jgi:hypothetical protein